MSESDQGQKTEDPTPKKLRDARRKGQVAQSRDLTGAATMAAAIAALVASGAHMVGELVALFGRSVAHASSAAPPAAQSLLWDGAKTGLVAIAPLLATALLVPAAVSYLQVGALFTTETLTPRLERLNPVAGLKRLLSLNSLVELLKGALKLAVLAAVAYVILRDGAGDIVRTVGAPTRNTVHLIIDLITRTAFAAALAFAGFAVLDVFYQRYRHRKELRMTKHEVKREHKETEGDPTHRGQRQRMHREILEHNMLQDVRKATVIVVNPDHIAVALLYDKDGEAAPRVVAKGSRVLAQKIISIAREAGVPVVRNVPLARALNRLELGEEIPDDLFEAVAEVLRFVYELAGESD